MSNVLRIGHGNRALMSRHGEIETVVLPVVIFGLDVRIEITIGRLVWEGIECRHAFVLIAHIDSGLMDEMRSTGHADNVLFDFGVEARTAVRTLCRERGWNIHEEISHAPVLHVLATEEDK